MQIEELRRRSRGIYVFAITPLLEKSGRTQVDEEGVRRNTESWVKAGIPVVVVCGGVGELWHLAQDEHIRVVEAAAQQAAGRVVVIAGVTGDTAQCVETARRVEEAGADGVLLFPDRESIRWREELVDFYTHVSGAVDIGIVPFRADETVDLETIRRLADLPNVIALKEESERLDEFKNIVREAGDRIIVAGAGSDQLAPCFLLMGAGALTSSLSNHLPGQLVDMWEAAQRGDFRTVTKIQGALRPIEILRQRHGHSLHKAAMEIIGLAGGPSRSGQARLGEAERTELRGHLSRLGAIQPDGV